MKMIIRAVYSVAAILVFALTTCLPVHAQKRIQDRFATVNGIRLHYLIAGKGDPVILLHGYAQNSHMWRPLIPQLAKTHTVIAPDLRGFGQSSKPSGGYYKKTMAQDIHALATSLGIRRAAVVGHDIGLMVAYAYAAQHPAEEDLIFEKSEAWRVATEGRNNYEPLRSTKLDRQLCGCLAPEQG